MSSCKFCSLLAQPDLGAALTNLLLETDQAVAALNRRPIAPGHLTIILKAHHARTSELGDAHLAGVGGLLGRLSATLEIIYKPDRVILLGDGKRSAHLHLHLIPEPKGATLDLGVAVADLNQAARTATLAEASIVSSLRTLRAALGP